MKPLHIKYILSILCFCLLVNCASGPDHETVKNSAAMKPSNGKGLVLVYREAGLAGAASKPFIWVNGTKMSGQLARGGFYSHDAQPGTAKVEFSWHDHDRTPGELVAQTALGGAVGVIVGGMGHEIIKVDFKVYPGQIQYILMDGIKLSEVSKEHAEEALADCRWLNAPGLNR